METVTFLVFRVEYQDGKIEFGYRRSNQSSELIFDSVAAMTESLASEMVKQASKSYFEVDFQSRDFIACRACTERPWRRYLPVTAVHIRDVWDMLRKKLPPTVVQPQSAAIAPLAEAS